MQYPKRESHAKNRHKIEFSDDSKRQRRRIINNLHPSPFRTTPVDSHPSIFQFNQGFPKSPFSKPHVRLHPITDPIFLYSISPIQYPLNLFVILVMPSCSKLNLLDLGFSGTKFP
ncbi:hypothetical protein Droror1_Dr00004979 [Drosera rotundifolia]